MNTQNTYNSNIAQTTCIAGIYFLKDQQCILWDEENGMLSCENEILATFYMSDDEIIITCDVNSLTPGNSFVSLMSVT